MVHFFSLTGKFYSALSRTIDKRMKTANLLVMWKLNTAELRHETVWTGKFRDAAFYNRTFLQPGINSIIQILFTFRIFYRIVQICYFKTTFNALLCCQFCLFVHVLPHFLFSISIPFLFNNLSLFSLSLSVPCGAISPTCHNPSSYPIEHLTGSSTPMKLARHSPNSLQACPHRSETSLIVSDFTISV